MPRLYEICTGAGFTQSRPDGADCLRPTRDSAASNSSTSRSTDS